MAGSGFSFGLVAAAVLALAVTQLRAPESRTAPQPALQPPQQNETISQPVGNGLSGAEFARAPDGHFYAEATVNGAPVRFLIDTGASGVVLTRDDARRASVGGGDFTAEGIGAAGRIKLQPVMLSRLAIGTVAADNVPAMVAEPGLPVSLLGQSFLARWSRVEISGDRMVLR